MAARADHQPTYPGKRSKKSHQGYNATATNTNARGQPPTTREKLQLIGCILLLVSLIFAVTAMEAPIYLIYERGPGDPIRADDSHIGAPWRYFGVSVLWYIMLGTSVSGIIALVYSRRFSKNIRDG